MQFFSFSQIKLHFLGMFTEILPRAAYFVKISFNTSCKMQVIVNNTFLGKSDSKFVLCSQFFTNNLQYFLMNCLFTIFIWLKQKQPFRGVLRKRCFESMQQIYRKTPTLKHDFNKVGCSLVNLPHIFRTAFPKNTSDSPSIRFKELTLFSKQFLNF